MEVSVDKDNPLVYQILLGLKLDLNGFEHLDGLHYVLQSLLIQLHSSRLVHQQQVLDMSLDLNCQLNSVQDHDASVLEELSGLNLVGTDVVLQNV